MPYKSDTNFSPHKQSSEGEYKHKNHKLSKRRDLKRYLASPNAVSCPSFFRWWNVKVPKHLPSKLSPFCSTAHQPSLFTTQATLLWYCSTRNYLRQLFSLFFVLIIRYTLELTRSDYLLLCHEINLRSLTLILYSKW